MNAPYKTTHGDNNKLPHNISGNARFLRWFLIVLVSGYPALALLLKSVNVIGFYLLLLAGIFIIVTKKKPVGKTFFCFLLDYWPLWLAMSSLFFVECLNQLFVSGFDAGNIRFSLHFLALPFFVYAGLFLDTDDQAKMRWGFVLGAIACAVCFFVLTEMRGFRPQTNHYFSMRLIPFTNLVVLLGFWAALASDWLEAKKTKIVFLHIVALGASVFTAVLSLTRASWLSIVVLGVVLLFFFCQTSKKMLLQVLVVVTIFSTAAALASYHVPSRIAAIQANITDYSNKSNQDSSIGLRFQIYKTSWLIFQENPFFGVGRNNYQNEIHLKFLQGKISQAASELSHAHNQILDWMVKYGIFGLVLVFSYGIVPFFYFFRFLRSSDVKLRTVSYMGISMGIGFFIFGLTDVIYEWKPTIFFYVFMLSMLFAFLVRRQSELDVKDI